MSEHFKLYNAALCVECSTVFEMGPEACPSCTCTSFFYLSALIKPKELREEINLVRFMNSASAS